MLTPLFIQDYLERRGLTFLHVPCLETGLDAVREAVAQGVGVIGVSTTWLPSYFYNARDVRRALASLGEIAPECPIIVGGVAVRKAVKLRELLEQGRLVGIDREQAAEHSLLIDAHRDAAMSAAVIGELGEATLARIAQRVKDGARFDDLPNLAIPMPQGYRFTATEPESSSLNEEFVDWGRHQEVLRHGEAPISNIGWLSCPL